MRHSRGGWAAALLAVAAGVLITGCSSAELDERPALDTEAIVSTTSDFQKELLRDGTVTASEYESAILAYRTCVEDTGATPSEIYAVGNNEQTFDYQVVAANDQELVQINADAEACVSEYFDDVGSVWAYQQLLSPAEVEDLRPAVIECLRGAGVPVNDGQSYDELFQALSELVDLSVIQPCVEKYPGFFAVSPEEAKRHNESVEPDGHKH